ncbi:hypothetical protein EDD18DRAFT_1114145 [Armillaria luteobubalina]|uniref:Uncharacterized protein n=1 Tax=Armillaria luteobubalina TaxID=153913 RepID=A0AA39U6Q5_9AGAR|nr:hypothetical protein EDD18DRAFT_1114145 [Armillaria luteobubalina]
MVGQAEMGYESPVEYGSVKVKYWDQDPDVKISHGDGKKSTNNCQQTKQFDTEEFNATTAVYGATLPQMEGGATISVQTQIPNQSRHTNLPGWLHLTEAPIHRLQKQQEVMSVREKTKSKQEHLKRKSAKTIFYQRLMSSTLNRAQKANIIKYGTKAYFGWTGHGRSQMGHQRWWWKAMSMKMAGGTAMWFELSWGKPESWQCWQNQLWQCILKSSGTFKVC